MVASARQVFREAEVATMLQQLQTRRNQGEPGAGLYKRRFI
jgi:hypothetical protein